MKRIVLFRFHAHASICVNRLRLLKHHNPDVAIFGLYGGPEEKFSHFERVLLPHLENVYCIQGRTPSWKWKNGDLAVRLWNNAVGKELSFDMLHLVEWDLVLMAPLATIYEGVSLDRIGCASLLPVREIEEDWIWTGKEPFRSEYRELLGLVKKKFGDHQDPCAIQGPGLCFPREFLDAYSRADIPELSNDEARIPLFCHAFGFKMHDMGFCGHWFDNNDCLTFHCRLHPEISPRVIERELVGPSGKKVFHPCRRTLAVPGGGRVALTTMALETIVSTWKKFRWSF